MLPTEKIQVLVKDFGISIKDAKTLVSLNDGQRLDYFENVVATMLKQLGKGELRSEELGGKIGIGLLVSNW